jgi:hypothetical protein
LQEVDSVGEVGGLNCGEGLEPKRLEVRWKFFFGDLGHGVKIIAVFKKSLDGEDRAENGV